MKRLVAVDPGLTTGYVDVLHSSDGMFEVVRALEIAWEDRFALLKLLGTSSVQGTLGLPLPDTIVVESFRLYAHHATNQIGNSFPSVQIIGIVEAYAHLLGIIDHIVYQPASVRKFVEVLPDHKQIVIGSDHKTDAYQHARYYVVTHKN